MQGVKVGARIAPNAFATADGGDCTEALRRFQRAGGFAFGQSPKRAAIIPDSRRDVIFNTSYRRFLARRCCRFNEAAGAAAGATGGNAGGHCSRWGALQGVALWPIDTHRARHKQSRSGTGRPPPRAPVPWP